MAFDSVSALSTQFAIMPTIATAATEVGSIAITRTLALATRLISMLSDNRKQSAAEISGKPSVTDAAGETRSESALVHQSHEWRRERSLAAAENELLREILVRDSSAAASPLLRRLVPHSSSGGAALISLSGGEQHVLASRGMTARSVASLCLSGESLDRLENAPLLFTDDARHTLSLVSGLDEQDRQKMRSLFLVPVRDRETSKLTAVLLTSSLWPVGVPQREQLMVVVHAAQAAVRLCRQEHQIRHHAEELRLTRKMLELRAITDHATERPLETIGRCTSHLCRLVNMERATVFLVARRSGDSPQPIVEAGLHLPPSVVSAWKEHEIRLAKWAMSRLEGCVLEQRQLDELGIETLLGTAAVWPLISADRCHGAIVLSHQNHVRMLPNGRRLIEFGGELLSRTLRRIYDHAAIRRQARHDGLTDLVNRKTFDTLLAGEIDRVRLGLSDDCSLLLADLDRFKSVNDRFGHQAGDEVLRVTAQLLREHVGRVRAGERSVLARYGGEELAVLLPGVGMAGALRMAEEIRTAIENRVIEHGDRQFQVTTSIGVASCPRHALSQTELISAADGALYRAKAEGRNRVCAPMEAAESPA
jgi:diguanylate cyclase (GGDEF)-like protein